MVRRIKAKADRGRTVPAPRERSESDVVAVWRRIPKGDGLTLNLDKHVDEFWDRAARGGSIALEEFLFDLAARIRSGQADARERLLAARLIERQRGNRLPAGEQAARRARAIAEFVTHLTTIGRQKQEAAIATAAERFHCSRRTIFDALKVARETVSAEMADVFAPPVQRRR